LSAYTQANSATVTAQAAFNLANTSNGSYAQANAAYAHANSAFDTANSALTIALVAQTSYESSVNTSLAAFAQANAAFDKANTANVTGQAAFDKANTDTTNISTTAGVYGNSTIVPVITLAANGRVSSITNTAITFTANTLTHIDTVPSTNKGIVGHTKGMVFLANNFIYYCSTNYDGTTNIWSRIASTDAW
jgi:hypothetical protein